MYLGNNSTKVFSLGFIALSLILSKADAGRVRVINENMDPIFLSVIPEPSSEEAPYCWKCLTGPCSVPRKDVAELEIPSKCPINKERFAVIGTTGGFLFNGKCKNLSVFKNYELIFSNDFMGTSCVCREI